MSLVAEALSSWRVIPMANAVTDIYQSAPKIAADLNKTQRARNRAELCRRAKATAQIAKDKLNAPFAHFDGQMAIIATLKKKAIDAQCEQAKLEHRRLQNPTFEQDMQNITDRLKDVLESYGDGEGNLSNPVVPELGFKAKLHTGYRHPTTKKKKSKKAKQCDEDEDEEEEEEEDDRQKKAKKPKKDETNKRKKPSKPAGLPVPDTEWTL